MQVQYMGQPEKQAQNDGVVSSSLLINMALF